VWIKCYYAYGEQSKYIEIRKLLYTTYIIIKECACMLFGKLNTTTLLWEEFAVQWKLKDKIYESKNNKYNSNFSIITTHLATLHCM
jgi:hypothetical protein